MTVSFFLQRYRTPLAVVLVAAAAGLLAYEFLDGVWARWFSGPQAMLGLLAIIVGVGLFALAIDFLWTRPPAVAPPPAPAAGAPSPALSPAAAAAHAETVAQAGEAVDAAMRHVVSEAERGSKNIEAAVMAWLAQADALLAAYRAQPASIAAGCALVVEVRRFMGSIAGDAEVQRRVRRAYGARIVPRVRALVDELAHVKREENDEGTARLMAQAAADAVATFGAESETIATVGRNLIAREQRRFPGSAEIAGIAAGMG